MRIWPGCSYPLGATWDGRGVNFALFAECSTKAELCLFDSADATKEAHRISLPERTNHVWHGYFPDIRPGQLYSYRVSGPYEPKNGHRFNPNKLLLDPYAKAIGRALKWDLSLYGYRLGDPEADLSFDERDSAAFAPLGVVVEPAFTWGNDTPATHTLAQKRDLRSACERFYQATCGHSGASSRYVCGPGVRTGCETFNRFGRNRR